MHVTFTVLKFNMVTIAGKLLSFNSTGKLAIVQRVGSHGGTQMTFAALGDLTEAQLFGKAHRENEELAWGLRFTGFVMIWLGAGMFFLPFVSFSGSIFYDLAEMVSY